METITQFYAINLTYGSMTFNTPSRWEYQHTGELFQEKTSKGIHEFANGTTMDEAKRRKKKTSKLFHSSGYYFVKRISIPTITASGKKDWWYINNDGDFFQVNKVSKYGRKTHAKLTEQILTLI